MGAYLFEIIENLMKAKLWMFLLVSFCAVDASATTDITKDIDEFVKAPVEYFKTHRDRYEWVDTNTLDILCQLPHTKDVESKLQEWAKLSALKNQIHLDEVRDNVKAFYAELFDDSELGQYLSSIANDAIDRAEFYTSTTITGSWVVPVINIADAPPYLRIRADHKMVSESLPDIYCKTVELSDDDKFNAIKEQATKIFPEYSCWNIYPQFRIENDKLCDIVIKFDNFNIGEKVYSNQPDFNEIYLIDRESVSKTMSKAVTAVFMTYMVQENDTDSKSVYSDPLDQKKYETWALKIFNKVTAPEEITKNWIVNVNYASPEDLEWTLAHEVGHIVDIAYLLKTGRKKVGQNWENVAVYFEVLYNKRELKIYRLLELYQEVYKIVRADFLRMKFKDIFESKETTSLTYDEIQEIVQHMDQSFIKGSNLYEKIQTIFTNNIVGDITGMTEADFLKAQFDGLSDHIVALNNAIQIRKKGLSTIEALQTLNDNFVVRITSDNFKETLKYLLS